MADFENYPQEARQLEIEIERKGIALGIDWENEFEVRRLARDALNFHLARETHFPTEPEEKARIELFGLAGLMLTVMKESAEDGFQVHGGKAWKAFGRALWREWQGRQPPSAAG